MKKRHLVLTAVFSLMTAALFALPEVDTTQLLLSYIENNSELKNLAIAVKKAALSYDSTKIDNGFDVTLSSGTITIKLAEDGSTVTAKPSVQAKLPQASNLSAGVQANLSYNSNTAKVTDTAVSVGVDIISAAGTTNRINLLKAERSLKEAERKLGKYVLSVEKEFYTELKGLLSTISSIMTLENDYYTDKIDLEAKKIQGYSASSTTYRKAELKVISEEHEISSKLHSFIHDYVVFYKKCGYDIQLEDNPDLMELVPSDIEAGDPLNILDFNKEEYASIENAKWTYKINSMERSANKNYSLSANAGYTFANSTTKSDTVDAGLTGTVGGVSLGAGVSLPVGTDSMYPALTLSMSITPNTFRKNNIKKQQNDLTEEQELLAIETAEAEYETKIVETQQKLESLLWEEKNIEANVSMYEQLEKDMAQLYKMGYTSESEYLSAKTNLDSYIIKKIINQIELIMFNDDVVMNFVPQEM